MSNWISNSVDEAYRSVVAGGPGMTERGGTAKEASDMTHSSVDLFADCIILRCYFI